MNIIIDGLTKPASVAAVMGNEYINSDSPLEKVRVSIGGEQITGNVLLPMMYHWGKQVPRELYHTNHIINRYEFHLVW